MKNLIAAAMVGVISITALSGCGVQDTANRKVIQKDDKQIVVIDEKQKSEIDKIGLDQILSFDGIRTLDWISEDTVLIMKDNKNMPQFQGEDMMVYPKNFYEFNINTNEEKLIADSKVNMVSGILSPDKKHIFYKEGVENSVTGFILNRETGKKTQITDIDSISFYEGRWLDNNTVIYASFPNSKIYTADINGKVTEIPVKQKGMLINAAKIGSNVYYTTIGGELYVQNQDVGVKSTKKLGENVLWLIPSPDMTKFAMVKHTAETERTLYITDLDGNVLKTLAKATQIYGTNWNNDGSKLAFSTMDMNSTSGGIFVADAEKGEIVQIATDFEDIADPLRWSPSGKQISATNITIEQNDYKIVTNIFKLK